MQLNTPVRGAPAAPSPRTSVGVGRSPPHTVAAPSSLSRPPCNRAPPPPGDGLRRRLGDELPPAGRLSAGGRARRLLTHPGRHCRPKPDSPPPELDPRCRPLSPRIEPCLASSALPPLRVAPPRRPPCEGGEGRGGIHSAARSAGEGRARAVGDGGGGGLCGGVGLGGGRDGGA
jgi:hypothetical protein